MKHSDAATALIEASEGCVLHAYPDPGTGGDPWTIGYGATGPDIAPGVVWTKAQAIARLDADLARFDAGVTALIGDHPTSQPQFDAMVSFAYNVGLANLATSTLLKMHLAGNFAGAATQFALWDHANHHVLQGLVVRRQKESALYAGT